MEIKRLGMNPHNPATGDVFYCVMEDCNDPERFLLLFKDKVWDLIKNDMEQYNFDFFHWRMKPQYIEEDSFDVQKLTKFRARVDYSRHTPSEQIEYYSSFKDFCGNQTPLEEEFADALYENREKMYLKD